MMDEVKMTLSIKSSSKLLNDAHGGGGQAMVAPENAEWPLGTIVVMMLAINTQAN